MYLTVCTITKKGKIQILITFSKRVLKSRHLKNVFTI